MRTTLQRSRMWFSVYGASLARRLDAGPARNNYLFRPFCAAPVEEPWSRQRQRRADHGLMPEWFFIYKVNCGKGEGNVSVIAGCRCVWRGWMDGVTLWQQHPRRSSSAHSEKEETAGRGWCGWMAVDVLVLCVHGEAFRSRSWSTASSCVLLTNTMTSTSVNDARSFVLVCLTVKQALGIHLDCNVSFVLLLFPVPPMMLCQLFFILCGPATRFCASYFKGSLSRSNWEKAVC